MNIELWKKRKKELKLTHDELAKKSGISRRTIAGIFSGDPKYSSPTYNTVQAIERALEITPSDLQWTAEERALGITDTIKISVTPEEEEILYLYRQIVKKKGEAAHEVLLALLESLEKID